MNNWQTKKLGEVTDILMGQSPPSNTYNDTKIGLPFFQGKADFNELYPTITKYCSNPVRVANRDDVLLSVRAPVGPVNLSPSKVCIGRGLSAIKGKQNLLNQMFLFYFMKLNEFALSKKGTGSAFSSINRKDIEMIELPLPTLSIQQQIVEKLDTIRKLQELNQKEIEKAEELFKTQLSNSFKLLKQQKKVKLADICDVRDGTHDSPKYQPSGIPLVTTKNLKDDLIDFTNINYISEKDHQQIIKRSFVENGDILFGMIGTIGNPVIVETERKFSIKNVGLIKFPNKKIVNNLFVKYFLQSPLLESEIKRLSRGGTQKFVSLGNLRNLLIPLPLIKEQKEITSKLEKIRTYNSILIEKKLKLLELFESMLNKAMRGELI